MNSLLLPLLFTLAADPAPDWKTEEAKSLTNIKQLTFDFVRAGLVLGFLSPSRTLEPRDALLGPAEWDDFNLGRSCGGIRASRSPV